MEHKFVSHVMAHALKAHESNTRLSPASRTPLTLSHFLRPLVATPWYRGCRDAHFCTQGYVRYQRAVYSGGDSRSPGFWRGHSTKLLDFYGIRDPRYIADLLTGIFTGI